MKLEELNNELKLKLEDTESKLFILNEKYSTLE